MKQPWKITLSILFELIPTLIQLIKSKTEKPNPEKPNPETSNNPK